MNDHLATYLHDHMAGATYAIELIEFLQAEDSRPAPQSFTAQLLSEVREDSEVLRELVERLGAERSLLKDAVATVGEKLSRFKLHHSISGELGTFQALELLGLGILGKRALWRALAAVAPADPRLGGLDFDRLIDRAESQHARVEERRVAAAEQALRPPRE